MNVKEVLSELRYVGEAQGIRQTYHIFQGRQRFLVMSFKKADPAAGNFNLVEADAVSYVEGKYRGVKGLTAKQLFEEFQAHQTLQGPICRPERAVRARRRREGRHRSPLQARDAGVQPAVSETARLLARVTAGLYARGLVTASGGNLDARGTRIRPARSGSRRPAGSRATCSRNTWPASAWTTSRAPRDEPRPSTEWRVHRAIYRSRPDVWAVVHTHAPQATRLALTGTRFLPISLEAALIGPLPVVPFLMPGTEALAEAVASALGAGAAVLMQNHGLVVAAESLEHAAALTETIEATAGTLLACRMLGITPPVLSEDEIREARAKGSYGG